MTPSNRNIKSKIVVFLLTASMSFVALSSPHCAAQAETPSVEDVSITLAHAVAAYRKKQVADAKRLFEAVLILEPDNADANFSLGCIAEDSGDLANAVRYYQHALRAKPDDTETFIAVEQAKKKMANQHLRLPIKLPYDPLVHAIAMNNTPVATVITELCQRAGLTAIIDKSVDGKTMTASYSDETESEILASIFSTCQLQADPIAEKIILIQGKDAEHQQYAPNDEPQEALPPQTATTAGYRYGLLPGPPKFRRAGKGGLVPQPPPTTPSIVPEY